MSKSGMQPLRARLIFSQTDPADLMPAYIPLNLSLDQQEKLDAFKFTTMRLDSKYFQENPEISDIVGYIIQNVLNDRPRNMKQYLTDLFQQEDIEEKIKNYHCKGSLDIEEVIDQGYQEVDHNIDPCGISHKNNRVCDGHNNEHIMKRMEEIYAQRDEMIPSFNTSFRHACDTKFLDAALVGAPQDNLLYGGDYIFLRNTRCGRQIAQHIGDTREIPTRVWKEVTESQVMDLEMSYDLSEEEIPEKKAEAEGGIERENFDTESQVIMSRASSFQLRKYFESDHPTPLEHRRGLDPDTLSEIHPPENETKEDTSDNNDNK